MIGLDCYSMMTAKIESPGIPSVGQRAFDEFLRRSVGCRLCWNRKRRVFHVYRDNGRFNYPTMYPMEFGNQHYPLSTALANLTADAVRMADAFQNEDGSKALRVFKKRQDDMADDERRKWIEDALPDFKHRMTWMFKRLTEHGAKRAYLDATAQTAHGHN